MLQPLRAHANLPSRCMLFSFNGQSLHLSRSLAAPIRHKSPKPGPVIMMVKQNIQCIKGTGEQTIPNVCLIKSRDGTNGVARFKFNQPYVLNSTGEVGDIIGFYMTDEEGVLQSADISAKFIKEKSTGMDARYVMRSPCDWDRFMRFME
ncbi:photosystem II reaction center PSB28 protein, chloroplastic-like [Carica papaya]|uniref:photosystem II reaction center PSB28 protein, chloroplastic-like n=1 Tax=Carica papaya TaxID=3649 RepID=UPI000B8D0AAC|nr:photosystem II reaction center PSB28 protein, chloroplastic-like [Carica papaya]